MSAALTRKVFDLADGLPSSAYLVVADSQVHEGVTIQAYSVINRIGRGREVAEVWTHDTGAIGARRTVGCERTTDYALWSRVCKLVGGSTEDYYAGLRLAQ